MTRRAAVLTVAVLLVGACGDGPSAPNEISGAYRLVSVNGQPLPFVLPPSLGFAQPPIEHGDLFLRGNGTYGLGIGGPIGWFSSGTYRLASDRVRLTGTTGAVPDTFSVTIAGDSAVIQDVVYRFVFKRTAAPQTITAGVFVLASINGRGPPLTEYDTVINGERFVGRVHYDTLRLIDGLYYERRRSESAVRYLAGGDSLMSALEWTTLGAHDAVTGAVVLRGYWRDNFEPRRDTLFTVGSDLVRRTQLITGLQEDRYVRR